jgi:hypothetical protein
MALQCIRWLLKINLREYTYVLERASEGVLCHPACDFSTLLPASPHVSRQRNSAMRVAQPVHVVSGSRSVPPGAPHDQLHYKMFALRECICEAMAISQLRRRCACPYATALRLFL